MNEDTSQPAVSVVVPLFNEEENVPILQAELSAALAGIPHEIIFVDDGSTDQTLSRLTRTPEIRVLRFEKNAGQSAAMYRRHQRRPRRDRGPDRRRPAKRPGRYSTTPGRDRARSRFGLRLPRAAQRHPGQTPNEPDRKFCPEPFHQRRGARYRLHAEGDAARMRAHPGAFQGDAPFHSRARQRRRLSAGRDPG